MRAYESSENVFDEMIINMNVVLKETVSSHRDIAVEMQVLNQNCLSGD